MSTSSTASESLPVFILEPSRRLRALLLFLPPVVALLIVAAPGLGLAETMTLLALLALLTARMLGRHWPSSPFAAHRLTPLPDGFWSIESRNGRCHVAAQRDAIAHPWGVVLATGPGPYGATVVILPDALDGEAHRRLRRQVRGW